MIQLRSVITSADNTGAKKLMIFLFFKQKTAYEITV